jgi:hypothetical protein
MKWPMAVLVASTVICLPQAAPCQAELQQDEKVKAFVEGVRKLHPRDEGSEAQLQTLVWQYVPAQGPVGAFLEFMEASGFKCPWVHSLAPEITRENPSFSCKLDVSPPPSFWTSPILEHALFYVTANCDTNRNIVSVDANTFYGLTGP